MQHKLYELLKKFSCQHLICTIFTIIALTIIMFIQKIENIKDQKKNNVLIYRFS